MRKLAIANKTRALAKRGSHALQTGYWHSAERVCPDFPNENFVNHLKVYRFASQFVSGKKVLDVGCGTGYGSALFAESASSVVGIDLSRQALRYARSHYRNSNLQYLRMNAEALSLADRSFHFVMSTENFEHLGNQQANLREMARVLTDDGMLLLGTPNHEMFLETHNRYHAHEIVYEELLAMIGQFFGECLIAENLLQPTTARGQSMREERRKMGVLGADLSMDRSLWSKPIDITWLSNTHSFLCFARLPRRTSLT